jgi:fatty acid kinase/fatty acid kinase fatty acid binding subunit
VHQETGKTISVLDSRNLSGSLGLLVYKVASAIADGLEHEEILNQMDHWVSRTSILVSIKNLNSMVRGGRVSPMKGVVANLLNLKPIISVDNDGKSCMYREAFSQAGNIRKVLGIIAKKLKTMKVWKYSVLHAHDLQGAHVYASRLEALMGKPPDFIIDISPVVGLNAGHGALAVAIMFD